MKLRQSLIDAAVIFFLTFAVNLAVAYLYGIIVHGSGKLEWETASRLAITLGIIVPWVLRRQKA